MKEKFVIIGNCITAVSAIKAIREIDQESEIHLFGEEKNYPYNRIRLSKGLLSTLEEDKILLKKKDWYKENHVQTYFDKKAVSLDLDKKEVQFHDGSKTSYTKILIATGARNYIPLIDGIDKRGIFTLRNLEDAKRIIEYESQSNKILNIGGGIQGLETAWILSQINKKVILAELLPRLMPKQLDEKASQILEEAILAHGINIMLDTKINELLGKEKVESFKTQREEILSCDMVLYSIGILPNIDFIKDSSVKFNRGILVNEKMQTNMENVYAAGDVAEFNGQVLGLWNIAIEQGKIAGYNMAGENKIYEHIVPVTTLNAFGISLFSMGEVEEKKATNLIVQDQSKEKQYIKILIKDKKVIGAIMIGNTKISPILKTAIEKEIIFENIDFKNVSVEEMIDIIKANKS